MVTVGGERRAVEKDSNSTLHDLGVVDPSLKYTFTVLEIDENPIVYVSEVGCRY